VKILSIDIDYMYSPLISEYDDLVKGKSISVEEQKKILSAAGFTPMVNVEKKKSVIKYLSRLNCVAIPKVICQNHDEILAFIGNLPAVTIVNIDHHHDVFYPGWHDINVVDEGNWVHHLSRRTNLNYTWVRNKDSENISDNVKIDFLYKELYLEKLDEKEFDLIFICISPHWTGKDRFGVVQELLCEMI